ncbi:MAG: hypothetical protein V1810_03325 [Candidatus Beckwithbacteria bacterium]
MKKIIILILLILAFPAFINAQEATDSSLTDKIKERLEKTAEEGLDTIKEELTAKAKSPKRKAYIGSITAINANQITLSYKNQTFIVVVPDETEIVQSFGQKVLTLTDLEINDYLIALGFVQPDQNQLETRKITVISTPQDALNHQLLSGQIEEVDGNKIVITGKTLNLTGKTNLEIVGIANPSVEKLELKDYLFAIVLIDKNGDIDAVKNVLVIPGKNNPAAMTPTNATQSALPATDSATIE